jgi:hypothetical protein
MAPSSAATITVSVHGGYDKSDLVGLYLTNDFQTGGYGVGTPGAIIPADTNIHATGWGFTPQFTSSFGWSANAKPGRDNMTQGGSINAAIDLSDAIRLTSITAYDYFRRAELQSWDASAANESRNSGMATNTSSPENYGYPRRVRASSTGSAASITPTSCKKTGSNPTSPTASGSSPTRISARSSIPSAALARSTIM